MPSSSIISSWDMSCRPRRPQPNFGARARARLGSARRRDARSGPPRIMQRSRRPGSSPLAGRTRPRGRPQCRGRRGGGGNTLFASDGCGRMDRCRSGTHRELVSDDALALDGVDDVRGDLIALEPLHLHRAQSACVRCGAKLRTPLLHFIF